MIGLCGAHRTGKTSLARAYTQATGAMFIESPVTKIWTELGLDPSKPNFDFKTRLDAQELILERLDKEYAAAAGVNAIADRTPIDMLGYTMAEALSNNVTDADMDRFHRYVQRCFDVLNRRFSVLLLIQPGIALQPAANKGALNEAYIAHLNSLMFGLSVDERVHIPHFYMPRANTDLAERLTSLKNAVARSHQSVQRECAQLKLDGVAMQ
ncbi:AAA family ATPase [Duganella sp. FT27W]|uniref:AAA family ATPase n=1 Tax=Duganella sp. FT27W TaxID=2654636 RepID=UPI00128CC3B6|nr:AAA family ATPase [Duganella sp. FT27W]MPQ56365.1 AAA family ATPase [Duganella sp. FT27W]